ncbi:MAG: conjugal transfer protein TraH [Rubrivivax sp.]|nr:conjugal transfer protein TraH [Rubrivivax sp.]
MRRLFNRIVATGLILATHAMGAAQAADLSQQMATMFGSGALANVTGPGAYRSQTQNIYVGGELQLRFPSRNYQFWSFTMPSINAGCGGVDAYMGSFSHISSDQFKDMLEAVARSYAGLLFKAALKSINPLIESVIGDLQKSLESWSQASGNTCAMAETMLDASWSDNGVTSRSQCVQYAMAQYGEDRAAAEQRCRRGTAGPNADARSSANPAVRELADRDINIVWEALRGSSLPSDEKTVFMNIAGTVVVFKAANNGDAPRSPVEHSASIDSLAVLLHGNAPDPNDSLVRIDNWLACDSDECLNPTAAPATITPFTTHVRTMLAGIRDAVVARTPLTAAQIQFVNMTNVPVYRMLAVGYTGSSAAGDSDLVDLLIERYAKVIAYDYAYTFMRRALKDLRVYLGMARLRNRVEETQSRKMMDNVDRLMTEVEAEHSKALARVRDANAVVEQLMQLERNMRASLPGSIRGMLDLSSLMRGGVTRN